VDQVDGAGESRPQDDGAGDSEPQGARSQREELTRGSSSGKFLKVSGMHPCTVIFTFLSQDRHLRNRVACYGCRL